VNELNDKVDSPEHFLNDGRDDDDANCGSLTLEKERLAETAALSIDTLHMMCGWSELSSSV
jgi:hypothetical protein